MTTSDFRDRLAALLATPISDLGLDLEDVEVTSAGKRSVVRVSVDRDGGIDLDTVAEATRAISQVLDESDVMGERSYTLEVGSRGVDKPLQLPRHWRRNVSRLVTATMNDGTSLTGRIVAADDDAASVDVDGEQHNLPYTEVKKAKIQIEFTKGS